jgi:uncharacterized membrane protein
MTVQHDPDAVARYAAAVRAAVADLGDEERAQLLDDLEAHLQEVAAESGAPLTERLGPPEAYAAELRAAYGAPPGASGQTRGPAPTPVRNHAWRRRAAVFLLLAVILCAGVVVWQVSQSGANAGTAQPWSFARLQSEAAAGHVSQVEIQGRNGIATDRGGVRHAVNLPDDTAALATELTADNVNVAYQQQSSPAFHVLYLVGLLFFVLPAAVVLVLVGLLIGVLWRLYRRLGRPTGWADH